MATLFTTVYDRFFGKITDDMYLELTEQDTLKDLRSLLIDSIPYFEFPRKKLSFILDYSIYESQDGGVHWTEIDGDGSGSTTKPDTDPDDPSSSLENLETDDDYYWTDLGGENAAAASAEYDNEGAMISLSAQAIRYSLNAAIDSGLEILTPEDDLYWNSMNKDSTTVVVTDDSYFEEDLTDEEINIIAILMMRAWLQRQITSVEHTRMKYSGTDFKMTSQANHLAKLLTLSTELRRQSTHMQRLYKRRRTNSDGYIESNWSVLRESSVFNEK